MFIIDKNAQEYIQKQCGSVVIRLKFEPAMGGWACSNKHVTGSYVPVISIAEPPEGEKSQYRIININGIRVYYPPTLQIKQGVSVARIRLRKILFLMWLELEGVKSTATFN